MSDQSNKTPANRPANPRVFRPFAGRPASEGEAEGKGSPAPGSESPGRGAPRAVRPFIAKSDARSNLASPADVAARNLEPPAPSGAPPAASWTLSEDIAETERPSQSITAEVPTYDDHRATPAILEAIAEPLRKTTVTRELPAIPEDDEEPVGSPAQEAAFAVSERESVELLDAATFVSPRGGAVAESMIDEVDAAFITAGLPAAEPVASPEAMRAAAALEDIAELLRAGAIELRPTPGMSMTSKESALASVLAALLAKR